MEAIQTHHGSPAGILGKCSSCNVSITGVESMYMFLREHASIDVCMICYNALKQSNCVGIDLRGNDDRS